MTKSVSFTLSLSEEEEPLWGFLHSFPREQWEGILKEALRAYSASPTVTEEVKPASVGLWSIEELYATAPDVAGDSLITDHPQPLKHLWELLGEETDEEVLELLLQPEPQPQAPAPAQNPGVQERNALPPGEDKEPQKCRDSEAVKGLDFLLHQVIGEEEDPEVLRFLSSCENQKET